MRVGIVTSEVVLLHPRCSIDVYVHCSLFAVHCSLCSDQSEAQVPADAGQVEGVGPGSVRPGGVEARRGDAEARSTDGGELGLRFASCFLFNCLLFPSCRLFLAFLHLPFI